MSETRTDESHQVLHTHRWVRNVWMSRVPHSTHMDESYTHEWVMVRITHTCRSHTHIYMSRVTHDTHMDKSRTRGWVMSESCHANPSGGGRAYRQGAVCCSMLQYVAVCCSVLQWVYCSKSVAMCCSVLQCVQCVAVYCKGIAVCCTFGARGVLIAGGWPAGVSHSSSDWSWFRAAPAEKSIKWLVHM